ncbi:MAG TPA: organomercurial lyase [Pseudolysinimonas sp.]|nr:organomercurial lyase [Pseudolysinimonas sp.]
MSAATAPTPDPRVVERVRSHIYVQLAATGDAPTVLAVADRLGLRPLEAAGAFDALAAGRHLVLDADRRILMAHPFSTIPLRFSVMGAHTLWWGGCAWDSFAIPHLVPDEPTVLVATTCPNCFTPHSWLVQRSGPPAGEQVAHFLTPMSRVWDDVIQTCGNQSIFCSESCVEQWLAATGHPRGYVMSLETLWNLARGWYAGRLDSPYTRREPAEAAAYFASVGLRGAFWGLPE